MKSYDKIPLPCETTARRLVNLSSCGLSFIPVLAETHYNNQVKPPARHRHNGFIEILFCMRGENTAYDCEGEEISFRSGDVFVAQPKTHHFLKSYNKGLKMYWMWIKLARDQKQFPHLMNDESKELTKKLCSLPTHFFGGERIRSAFQNVWQAYKISDKNPLRKVNIRLAIYELLIKLTEAPEKQNEIYTPKSLDLVLKEMKENPSVDYTIDMLARRLGVNSVSLNQFFKRATGLPPHAYLTSLRIDKAKEMLLKDKHKISSIASTLGYPSSQYFATQFKATTGLSPIAWRNKINKPK